MAPHYKGGGRTQQLRSPHYKRLGHLELWQTGVRMRLGKGVSLSGLLDPSGATRDEVDLNSMGGVIEEIWV